MYIHELLEQAKKGATVHHSSVQETVCLNADNCFEWEDGEDSLKLSCEFLDNRWEIETPAPGACTRCKGLGRVDIMHLDIDEPEKIVIPNSLDEAYECPVCKGKGKPSLAVKRNFSKLT